MKNTAVEWLVEQLTPMNWTKEYMLDYNKDIIEQAKEMEQQQIIDTYISGYTNGVESMIDENLSVPSPEEYYNETFKSK